MAEGAAAAAAPDAKSGEGNGGVRYTATEACGPGGPCGGNGGTQGILGGGWKKCGDCRAGGNSCVMEMDRREQERLTHWQHVPSSAEAEAAIEAGHLL